MDTGSVTALVIGIALLIAPVCMAILWIRRSMRRASWTRTEATVRFVRRIKRSTSATSSVEAEKVTQTQYTYTDSQGRQHQGESEVLKNPEVGDVVEALYDPNNPGSSELVGPNSLLVNLLTRGAVFIVLGALGLFLVIAALDVVSV
ncbi:DUF3592 domain-containing protein [Nocardioides sp. WG-D5]|uniref:DUF3592 domain-containing protein n=1 Tax=Nocardioides luteus TaxID=1844 RepID=UPI0018C8D749|nr:DUF3592 domain-containing protein [Nocardioides luteus]MBG6098977.1 hypothetical protein [Nocardioides luteus]